MFEKEIIATIIICIVAIIAAYTQLKKQPVTIKAAVIGAIIGGVFLILNTFLTKNVYNIENDVVVKYTKINSFKYKKDDGSGFLNVKNMLNINDGVDIIKSGYVDLIGDGNSEEYFIIFKDSSDKSGYIVFTSKRHGRPELLFRDRITDSSDIIFFLRNNKPQILIYNVAGSGGFLSFFIREYNGKSKLDSLFDSDFYAGGKFHFINDSIFITKFGMNYALIYDNGYKVIEYNDESITLADFPVDKIISFSNNSKLKIFINKKEIEFNEIKENVTYETKEYIELDKNDMLIVDSKIQDGKPISIRMLINSGKNSNINFVDNGYYNKIIFKKNGNYSIVFNCNLDEDISAWYYINIIVK